MSKKLKNLLFVLMIFSNITFILSGMLMTFWIINTMNAAMEFLTNPASLILMMVLFTFSFIMSPLYVAAYILLLRRENRRKTK